MEDFKEVYEQMKEHGMVVPVNRINFKIPESETVLKNCFKYFLSLEGTEFKWQSEYSGIADWLSDNHGRGLFMYGDCGRGKSMLLRYVIPAILLKYHRKVVRVYDVQQMNRQIDEVLSKHIVGIDDIGNESVAIKYGDKRTAFAEVMDNAEKYSKLVIISTNLNKESLSEMYGNRILDRIVSVTKRVEFKGNSLRK